ncbi:MAG: hypothetical protein GY821_06395 [Gammaproteobacteria bacterium]|nr:hypothetical protein [Gammaproteobacteria bacterium]
MGRRHQLINSVIHIIDHNRDGSYRTRHDRQTALIAMMKELYGLGYQLNHIRYVKTKHVWKLAEHWQSHHISVGSIKNRLCHIRWLAGKINKANIVPSNDQLKIAKRSYVSDTNESRQLTAEELSRIAEPRMRLSLRAQMLFGLRVEESLKIQPRLADQDDKLYLIPIAISFKVYSSTVWSIAIAPTLYFLKSHSKRCMRHRQWHHNFYNNDWRDDVFLSTPKLAPWHSVLAHKEAKE